MRASTLSTAPGGPASAPGTVPVAGGWGPDPARQFRAVSYLGLACGALAEGVEVDPETTLLRGTFLPLDYDALAPPAPLAPARVRAQGGLLLVDLGGVRRVRRVVISRNARTGRAALELYRLDGDRPAAQPTLRVERALDAAEVDWAVEETLVDVDVRAAASPHGDAHEAVHETPHGEAWRPDEVVFPLSDAFEDVRFALGITRDGDRPALVAGDLVALAVTAEPLNPRLGLADPSGEGADPLADLLLFWPDPAAPPGASGAEVAAGAPLAESLAVHLSRRAAELRAGGAPLPARLDVALVAAADAPCRLRFDGFAVEYHLARVSLEPPGEKLVLRFPPDRVETREASVLVARGARMLEGRVEVLLGRAAGSGGAASQGVGIPALAGGLAVTEAGWSARRLDVAEAALAWGVDVALLPLAPGTEVAVEVREDAGGGPAGRLLAGGRVEPGAAGGARWAGVGFGAAVLVPSGPLWVRLRATRGRAVWLAGDWGPDVEAALLSAGGDDVAVLRGGQPLCSLRVAAAAATGRGVGLEVAGVAARASGEVQGRLAFDAAAALSGAAGAPGAGPVTAVLRFTAPPGALLTVYPPKVIYDL